MRTLLGVGFGMAGGAVIGFFGGWIIGIALMSLFVFPQGKGDPTGVGLSLGALSLGILSVPACILIGAGVGVLRTRPWYQRMLAGSGLGLLLGVLFHLVLFGLQIWAGLYTIPVTFVLLGALMGAVQSTLTLLADRLFGS